MENYIVSARKYRPGRFEDVIGQDHITTTLKNALSQKRMAQAFLFCGPRGVGKTTCARIWAKVINCEKPTADFDACGTCEPCRTFLEGASFNIFELDAASNNSVDDIRLLADQVRYAPQLGKYKVYIIDEVHMLSQAAFNAFLKTLEEPPAHAVFILATTEKHKIIPTILSRCQIYDFNRMSIADMVAHLRSIAAKESIKTDEEALHLIAEKADGAMRDALSIFDKLASFSPDGVFYNDVLKNLHVLDYDYYFRITEALIAQNTGEALLTFDEILKKGFPGDIFLEGLGQHLRNLYVLQLPETLKLLEVSEKLRVRYGEQAKIISPSFLVTGLNIVNQCGQQYRTSENKRLEIELCLLKLAYAQEVLKIPFKMPEARPLLPAFGKSSKPHAVTGNPDATANNPKPPKAEKMPAKSVTDSYQAAQAPASKLIQEQAPPNYGKTVKINLFSALEDDIEEEKEKLSLTNELLGNEWKNHIQNIASESIRNVCHAYQPTLLDNQIIFEVKAAMHKAIIDKEMSGFRELLTTLTDVEDIIPVVTVVATDDDESNHPRFMNPKDRLQLMLKVNPQLLKLNEVLDLRIDF